MSAPLVLDDGLQFGLGVFETIAVEGGHGVLLQAHLARLARSAAALGLGELPARGVTREEMCIRDSRSSVLSLRGRFPLSGGNVPKGQKG